MIYCPFLMHYLQQDWDILKYFSSVLFGCTVYEKWDAILWFWKLTNFKLLTLLHWQRQFYSLDSWRWMAVILPGFKIPFSRRMIFYRATQKPKNELLCLFGSNGSATKCTVCTSTFVPAFFGSNMIHFIFWTVFRICQIPVDFLHPCKTILPTTILYVYWTFKYQGNLFVSIAFWM